MNCSSSRRKLVFVINSLAGGGAERVLATMVREFNIRYRDWELQLVTLDNEPDKYAIPDEIVRHRLDCRGALLRSYFSLHDVVRRERPDILVAFLTRANLAAALVGWQLGIRTVISERVNTSSHFSSRQGRQVFLWLIRRLYPLAARIICVSDGVRRDLETNFRISPKSLAVAHNPIDVDGIAAAAAADPEIALPANFLVAVGRLVPNKNMGLLMRALARSGTAFNLVVLGEGPERAELETLASDLGLTGRVVLPGHVTNPYAVMARAQGYVSASLAEGFPNALLEAMCIGKPVISTDCDSGPAEILAEKADLKVGACAQADHGILVPTNDEIAMSKAFRLLEDANTRRSYGERARTRSSAYSLDAAVDAYSAIIFPTEAMDAEVRIA